jgi:hypothetical protein
MYKKTRQGPTSDSILPGKFLSAAAYVHADWPST